MCLGIPGVVIKKVSDSEVIVDFGGIKKRVSSLLVPDISVGDKVIVHAGAIISKIDQKLFEEMIEIFKELEEAENNE